MTDRSGMGGGDGDPAPAFGLAWWLVPALMVAAWLPGVASSALFDPDEGRNASVAWAMAHGGSWLVPELNGLPFLDKPFLFFAFQALGMRLFGAGELAARLPSLTSGALLVALIAAFAWRRGGERVAWFAAVSAASSLLLIAFARVASFDALLALLVSIAVMSLFEAVEAGVAASGPGSSPLRRRWLLLAWAAMGFGVLTKGPVAIALPLLVVGVHAAIRRRARLLWSAECVACGFALILSWALLVEQRVPGFLRYALVEESWHRTTTTQFQRGGPLWYFLPILLVGAFPWILPAVAAAARALKRPRAASPERLLAALWLGIPLLLLSLSHSKRPQYMMLVLPAISLLAALALADARWRVKTVRAAAVTWMAVAVLLGAALGWRRDLALNALKIEDPEALALAAGLALVAAGSGVLAWLGRTRARAGVLMAALPIAALPWLSREVVAEVSASRSSRDLVAALEPLRRQGLALVGVDSFLPSLPFYLRDQVILSASSLHSLTSQSMLYFEPRIRESAPSSLRDEGWWRTALAGDRGDFAFLIHKGRESEISVLRSAGLDLLFEGRDHLVFGPGDGPASDLRRGAPRRRQSPAHGGPARKNRRGRGAL